VKELVSIGAGNAATALSQMLSRRIDIRVPVANLCEVSDFSEIFGSPETLVAATYMRLLNDVTGAIMLTFEKQTALDMADLLMGNQKGKTKNLNDMATSALKEAGTILSGAYLGAISEILGIKILISAPSIAIDMAGSISDAVLSEVCEDCDQALVITTEFFISDEKIRSYFFFIPSQDSLAKMMANLKLG